MLAVEGHATAEAARNTDEPPPERHPTMDETVTCIHCGQTVDRSGVDARGRTTCDEFAADADMQNEAHDFDLGSA